MLLPLYYLIHPTCEHARVRWHTHMYIHTYTLMYTCIHTHARTQMHTLTYTYMHVWRVRMHTYITSIALAVTGSKGCCDNTKQMV